MPYRSRATYEVTTRRRTSMPLVARPMAMVAGVLAASLVGASDAQAPPANLLTNGSFERAGAMRNTAALREKGFDVGPQGRPVPWADGWTVNPAACSGRARIVTGPGSSGGGKRYLNAESPTVTHLYTSGGEAGREELQMLRKDMAEMKSALQQLLEQQRQTAPSAPPEEDARRRRMRAMAD